MTELRPADAAATTARPEALTVGLWLATLQPAPPPALAGRLARALSEFAGLPGDRVPEACLDAGEQLLGELLSSGATTRSSAVNLLAIDALMTYAFQSAADEPERLEARAARAMIRIAEFAAKRND